jgi:2-polyprenyl-3-methyl-5-hydroxy-6-metoxy-1,4-benzoquinol methylase
MTGRALAVLEREVRRLFDVSEDAHLDQLKEPVRTWVAYALSTVERGRGALSDLGRAHPLPSGFRLLDAGCAYGGFLAAAVERGARQVVGVEIDEKLLRIARAFVSALGVDARIVAGSLGDATLMEGLGEFDVVTCADVIEHVVDPRRVLGLLAARVAAGGALYLAVPNAWSPTSVNHDPHYQLFGITLLPPADAQRYFELATGWPVYDVGEFYRLEEYESWLRELGLAPRLINEPANPQEAARQLEGEFRDLEAAAQKFDDARLTPELRQKVVAAAEQLARRGAQEVSRSRRLRRWGLAAGAASAVKLARRYGVVTWQVVAQRPA